MLAKDIVDIVASGATTLATVLAGLWAYYRYLKGRLFKPRLTLAISAQCLHADSSNYLVCALEMKNVGLTKVNIQKAHVRAVVLSSTPRRNVITTRKILLTQDWVEPGATINEQEAISCQTHSGIVKVEFSVVTGGSTFRATSIVEVPPLQSPVSDRNPTISEQSPRTEQ